MTVVLGVPDQEIRSAILFVLAQYDEHEFLGVDADELVRDVAAVSSYPTSSVDFMVRLMLRTGMLKLDPDSNAVRRPAEAARSAVVVDGRKRRK